MKNYRCCDDCFMKDAVQGIRLKGWESFKYFCPDHTICPDPSEVLEEYNWKGGKWIKNEAQHKDNQKAVKVRDGFEVKIDGSRLEIIAGKRLMKWIVTAINEYIPEMDDTTAQWAFTDYVVLGRMLEEEYKKQK